MAKLTWKQFCPDKVDDTQLNDFIESRKLAFTLCSSSSSPGGHSASSASDVLKSSEAHLLDLLKKDQFMIQEVFDFIQKDLRESIDTPEFVQLLTRVVCKSCYTKGSKGALLSFIDFPLVSVHDQFISQISGEKWNSEFFNRRKVVLQRYINTDANLSFHCLYSVQLLVKDFQHPPGEINTNMVSIIKPLSCEMSCVF